MRIGSRIMTGAMLGIALVVTTGCDKKVKEENAQLKEEVQQMGVASAERDSLLQIVVDNTQLMNEINQEISKVRGLKSGVVPVTNPESGQPDTVNAKPTCWTGSRKSRSTSTRANSGSSPPSPGLPGCPRSLTSSGRRYRNFRPSSTPRRSRWMA